MRSSHANVVEHFPFETVIHSYACSIQWLGLTGLARKPAASERQDEDSSAMDVNASCNHLPSSKSHSLVGASTLALGSPFQLGIIVSDMSLSLHRLMHSGLQCRRRVCGDNSDHSACRARSRMSCFSVHHHFHSRTQFISNTTATGTPPVTSCQPPARRTSSSKNTRSRTTLAINP